MESEEVFRTDSEKKIVSISSLQDFLKTFKDDNDVSKYANSITFDANSQTVIIHMQKLLKNESQIVGKSREEIIDTAHEKITQLSERYKEKFPELLSSFKEWKPIREKLIKTLNSTSNKLERNFAIVSGIRITTSAVDIFGTILRVGGKTENSWANFAMEQASTFGLLSLVAEKILARRRLKEVKKAIKSDQEHFKKIVNWFKQTEELDSAVKKIFPYGIDPDLTMKIAKSASESNECNKIFMSIIASNVEKDVQLFKDENFLYKANTFANSEAGKLWYHKLILKDDPNLSHCLNSELNEDIQRLLKTSQTDDPSLYVDGCRLLSSKVKMKIVLNLITIMSAFNNLLLENKPEESDTLQELSEKTNEELIGIKEIVRCLSPADSILDDSLQ